MSQSPLKPSVVLNILAGILQVTSDCKVLVHEPWPMPQLLVPTGSNVEINCTAAVGTADSPFWAIDLAADLSTTRLQFTNRKEQLNTHGVYELPQIETPLTLRLLINDTAINNQTEINCEPGGETISTILYVFDQNPLTLKILDVGIRSVNLTWDLSVGGADESFLLTISHGSSSSSESTSLTESHYHFTAPEGAPPCEVYNFSVTATYVGATYNGAGCSVPSFVNNNMIMLPSLPSIGRLESSLIYSLVQNSEKYTLNVSFEPAGSCDQFPILNYTLELKGPLPDMTVQSLVSILGENFTVDNISTKDSAFSFTILISNTVGTVSTKSRIFYTTDVQVVTAILMEGVNASIIQCEFVTGSTASGCMVVLTGIEAYIVNLNLTRNVSTNVATTTVSLEHPPSCYTGIEAFDIESDGSVGSLAVPGQLRGRLETPCAPLEVMPESSDSTLAQWIIVTFVLAALATALHVV